jgi:hypothetical protein
MQSATGNGDGGHARRVNQRPDEEEQHALVPYSDSDSDAEGEEVHARKPPRLVKCANASLCCLALLHAAAAAVRAQSLCVDANDLGDRVPG